MLSVQQFVEYGAAEIPSEKVVPLKIESFPMILMITNMGNIWTTQRVVPVYGTYLDDRILRERRPVRKRVSPIKMVRYSQPVVLEPPVFPQDPSWPAPPPSPPPPQPPLPQQPVEFKDKAKIILMLFCHHNLVIST